MLSPIGDKHSDVVLEYIITPAAEALDLQVTRADKIASSGDIPSEIFDKLLNADIVAAVLTGHNPNVFYELAIRHSLRRPFVHLIQEGEKIPFDVGNSRAVIYGMQVDQALQARERLEETMQAEIDKEADKIDVPFSIASQKFRVEQLGNAADEPLAEIARALTHLDVRFNQLDDRVSALSRRVTPRTRIGTGAPLSIGSSGGLTGSQPEYNPLTDPDLTERVRARLDELMRTTSVQGQD